ncbi:unnamed protein product [Adineta ricciae]|uniref:Amine oxidase n=1 Tax=Adineta ricciae TaxID=249248 RepID=A0A815D0P8_ADIRI|nr:unnamed protein product [Adineta ricciae]
MTSTGKSSNRTVDGFVCHANGIFEQGLLTTFARKNEICIEDREYDVIIVGAGFAGLIAARELSRRGRSILMVEARDRIGGRTFTAQVDDEQYEIGGTWIHWSQPHVWSEMTRYGFSLSESEGATTNQISLLLDNGTRLKTVSTADFYPRLFDLLNKFSNVDGQNGRTVLPQPHAPLTALDAIRAYDHLSMQDRLNQLSDLVDIDNEMYEVLDAYLSMNTQGDLAKSGFLDHLTFWSLGDYDTNRTWDKTSRYKIREGTSALAQAMLDDCDQVSLSLSTPIVSIHRTNENKVRIKTANGKIFTSRAAIVTVPLNVLHTIDFQPVLREEKQRAIAEKQCSGGTKFWAKLMHPIGNWCGFAPYPNPITVAYSDDPEGYIIVGFGPDDALDIRDIQKVEHELQKFIDDCKVQSVFGHDWRHDRFIQSTWSWYKPGQISANLQVLQSPEPPLFFASGDISNSWRGCIDGALQSGLTCVRQVQEYLNNR